MFKRLFARLKAVSVAIGDVVGRVILTLFYFLLLPPFALWSRWRTDPLRLAPGKRAEWQPREPEPDTLERAREQH